MQDDKLVSRLQYLSVDLQELCETMVYIKASIENTGKSQYIPSVISSIYKLADIISRRLDDIIVDAEQL